MSDQRVFTWAFRARRQGPPAVHLYRVFDGAVGARGCCGTLRTSNERLHIVTLDDTRFLIGDLRLCRHCARQIEIDSTFRGAYTLVRADTDHRLRWDVLPWSLKRTT